MSDETLTPPTLREAIAAMRIHAPSERNPRLAAFLAAANDDTSLKARWHVAQVNADRLDMSDHSWVHLQIVLNRALHLFRLLHRRGAAWWCARAGRGTRARACARAASRRVEA